MTFLRFFLISIALIGCHFLQEASADESGALVRKIQNASKEAQKNSGLYFDELFDAEGNIRPQYLDILPIYFSKSKEELEAIRKASLKDFRGDNALSALPRVFTEEEFTAVQKGVAQRGEALLAFLKDHYSGEKRYIKDGVIPKKVIEQIIARAGENGYEGKIDPNLIRFMYGPDIIRDAEGINRVLEDNTAFLGGQGDLILARESLLKNVPEYGKILNPESTVDPATFYKDLLQRYRSEMKDPSEKIIAFATPPYADKEDYRLQKIWKDLGVEWVVPNGKGGKRLVIKHDGAYLETNTKGKRKLEKIGYIIFNSEFHYSDASFIPARNQWLLKEAEEQLAYKGKFALPSAVKKGLERALKPDPKTGLINFQKIENILKINSPHFFDLHRSSVPGLLEAITSGKVLANNTPGTEFINDKEFNMYVEDIIRYYLEEEPILKNLPTRRLYTVDAKGNRIIDESVFKSLETNMDKYVIKIVDGRGGDGVWVGPKLKPEARVQLLERLKTDLSREIIVQDYAHPSVLAGDIVDLRVLSQVGYGGAKGNGQAVVYVPELGWSRGIGLQGDGKVNLSAGNAHEVTFVVRKGPFQQAVNALKASGAACALHFQKILRP